MSSVFFKMDNAMDWLKDILPIATTALGGLVWLIRIEGRINYAEKTLDRLQIKHEELENKIMDKLSVIEKSISRLEGMMMKDKPNV